MAESPYGLNLLGSVLLDEFERLGVFDMQTKAPSMPKYLIPSTAHEVAQALPLQSNLFVCLSCNKRGTLHTLSHSDCTLKYESDTSGWKPDPRYPVLHFDSSGRFTESIYHMDGLA